MNTKAILGVILIIPFIFFLGLLTLNDINFDINIGGHMERAANANTIELATQEMKIVVNNMKNKGMTSGYTSVIYKTPDEDVGYWYTNMNDSLSELYTISSNSSQLEKSNVLMKLRESLTSSESGSSGITVPEGITRFPYNTGYAIVGYIFLILCIIGLIFS